jgi:hypothetical protein
MHTFDFSSVGFFLFAFSCFCAASSIFRVLLSISWKNIILRLIQNVIRAQQL